MELPGEDHAGWRRLLSEVLGDQPTGATEFEVVADLDGERGEDQASEVSAVRPDGVDDRSA